MNKDKIEYYIVRAKKRIAQIVKEKNKERLGGIKKTNQEIVLAVAEFKCQKCGHDKELQVHHLIMRKAKNYMDFWRYASQRYYWANQIILCKKCHTEYHGSVEDEDMKCISQDRINKIKEKFS
jgi:5-methylcytosine-specific restriction endonuclease McrA